MLPCPESAGSTLESVGFSTVSGSGCTCVIVADNWTDLTDGGLDANISINESGGLPGWTAAWTNTTTTGTLADPTAQCADWSTSGVADPSQLGKYGLVTRADFLWTQYPSQMWCNDMNVIYCFEQ